MKKLLLTGLALGIVGVGTLTLMKSPRQYQEVTANSWKPDGPRKVVPEHPVLGINDTFRSLHGSTRNSDEVLTAVSPEVELDWLVEENMFITEGPSIDRQGNLYFSPVTPIGEEVVLVSLDGQTGERRWAIDGYSQGGGTPLVLEDPDRPGEQIIYLTLYERALAVKTTGEVIWDVSTGFKKTVDSVTGYENSHNFGASYLPQADAIVSVVMDGALMMLDRETGQNILKESFTVPGAPAKSAEALNLPDWIKNRADKALAEKVGEDPEHGGRFSRVADIVSGGGVIVANYFSIDPATGRMFIAATAPDSEDGHQDGFSENGAVYALDTVNDGGSWQVEIAAKAYFDGGTGSTPALSADGQKMYTSDEKGNILAYDRDLNLIWKHPVGEQIIASISVASENNELFVSTASSLHKVYDCGRFAEAGWSASLDMYPEAFGSQNLNLLTATIAANGIAMMAGNGFLTEKGQPMPLTSGVGLLDRETGEVKGYTRGVEESVATTITGPDGSFYVAHSPVRRAVTRALLGPAVDELIGGIARYKPVDKYKFGREILCSAALRTDNAIKYLEEAPDSAREDLKHTRVLLRQAMKMDESLVLEELQELFDGQLPDQKHQLKAVADHLRASCST